MIPSEPNERFHLLPSPTADTNVTYAMAVTVIVSVWVYGVRQNGLGGYLKHFVQPHWAMLPLNLIEEVTKPVSLALRLFGNIFAGGILLALIASLTAWTVGVIPVGGVLSVFFALLTVLYFGMASGHGEHDEHGEHEEDLADADDVTAESTQDREPALVA
jgi:F-type H+-transporting ATPase subunit a